MTTKKETKKEDAGLRYNSGKPRMSLIDGFSSKQLARVLTFGANKYAAHNWRKGLPISEIIDSLERHIADFKEGENVDNETGLPHMAHAMCNCMFAIWMLQYRPDLDDRWMAVFTREKTPIPAIKVSEFADRWIDMLGDILADFDMPAQQRQPASERGKKSELVTGALPVGLKAKKMKPKGVSTSRRG